MVQSVSRAQANYAQQLIVEGQRSFTSPARTPFRTLAEQVALKRISNMSPDQKRALLDDPSVNVSLAINALNDLVEGRPFHSIVSDLYATASGQHPECVSWGTHTPQILKYLLQKFVQYSFLEPHLDRLRQKDPAKAEKMKEKLTKLGLITACGGGGIPVPV
jgi:hypothetical protein